MGEVSMLADTMHVRMLASAVYNTHRRKISIVAMLVIHRVYYTLPVRAPRPVVLCLGALTGPREGETA